MSTPSTSTTVNIRCGCGAGIGLRSDTNDPGETSKHVRNALESAARNLGWHDLGGDPTCHMCAGASIAREALGPEPTRED